MDLTHNSLNDKGSMKEFIDLLLQNTNALDKMMESIVYTPEAYLYAYEHTPLEKRSQNNIQLFNVIKQCDDSIFNHYYFKHLEGKIDIEFLRTQALHRPENKKLKLHVEELDNPKSMDNLVEALFSYCRAAQTNPQQKEYYDAFFEKNLKALLKVNQLTSKKSRTAKIFCSWMSDIANHDGMNVFMDVLEKTQVNFLNISEKTGNRLDLLFSKELTQEDFKGFDRFFALDKDKPRYNMLKKYTNCFNTIDFLKNEKYSAETLLYFWDILKEEMQDLAKSYNFFSQLKECKTDTELLNVILRDKTLLYKIGVHNEYMVKGIEDKIMARLNHTLLTQQLNTTQAVHSKKRKI